MQPQRETHAKYRPGEKKMQKYKIHDKIEKRKWICNANLRINIRLMARRRRQLPLWWAL